jgi:CheY-like chemotaxis protein
VIEDNPADVYLIRQALRTHNIPSDVTVLHDGEEGYNFIEAVDRGVIETPDLFILDLSLPRRNGPELLERIRQSRCAAYARVVVASSSQAPRDRAIAERGADRYFVKPSSLTDFMQIGKVVTELLGS